LIGVAVVDEDGEVERSLAASVIRPLADILLPDSGIEDTHCLRYIDSYGDTVFNRLQFDQLRDEIEARKAVATPIQQNGLNRILDLITFAQAEPHRYVRFYGD